MDHLQLFNHTAISANPNLQGRSLPVSLDQPLKDTDLDSLDKVITSVYLCELYGIEESVGKSMPLDSVRAVFDFIGRHKTKEPASLEEALEQLP